MPRNNRANLILQLARQIGIRDPRAVLSVAAQEGLGGGIGDSGTSFGPFQLHVGGAFPQHIRGNRQAWAWSKPGLLYALSQIKRVAGNKSGDAAIRAIVNQFERPANPGAEIAKALAYYQRGGGGATDQPLLANQSVAGSPSSTGLLQAILAGGELPMSVFRPPAPMPLGGAVSPSQPLGGPGGYGVPAELFYDPLGAIKYGKRIAPIGGHSDHLHFAYNNPQQVLRALALARRLGLRVSENPYVDPVDPVHVKNSFHYRTFPGRYNGRRLGEAVDVSGKPQVMARLYKILAGGLK